MGLDVVSMAIARNYTDRSIEGLGAIKGANCTIKSTTKTGGDSIVTFEWTGTSGTKETASITVSDGVSIASISVDANNYLVCTMSDGTEQKAKIDLLDNVYTKTETDTLLLDKAEKNHNHDSAYASKDTEHEHSNKETLDKFGVNDGGKLTFNGDVVTPEASDLSDYLKKTDAQSTYVAKETGKGLSENDFTTVLKDAYDKAVEDSHTHSNKSVIDKFSESADGALLYDGQSIEADLSTVYKKTETYSQTESDDKFVAKESGKGLSTNDYTTEEKEKLAGLENYDDTQVKTQIQAVANGLMDSVGYSADYKTIDIIAKNGVKKSVDVAPIISHASVTELSDVDTTNKATGKALVYNAITSKHEYADVSGTDEKVKMDTSTDAKYLGELLDNVTITNENGELKVKKLDGQEVTITEINYLKGMTMNVMDLVNMFSNGGVKIINTPVATYAELLTLDKSSFIEGISYLVYVLADENHDNAKTTYLVDKDSETPTYFGFADSQRDFTTNPIDLATEITGKLGIANMDSDAIKALFTVDDTYKTETATNNAFSTHGAKALYDELLLAIGNKANNSDLTAHKDDANIHVSTEDRTNWDSAKTHADSAHAPSNAQENVLETVKLNGSVLTPTDKAVNVTVPTTVAELTDSADYAKTADIPTTLPANGGNADTVNNHTVETDVPTDAVFTDTIYDDTAVKGSISELSSNLDVLEFGEQSGGKNLLNCNDLVSGDYDYTNKTVRVTVDFNKRLFVKAGTSVSFSFTPTSKVNLIWLIVVDANNTILEELIVGATGNTVTNITKDGYLTPIFGGVLGSGDWTNITINDVIECKPQIEFNNVVTEYEPYIPSVKMLADETVQQNTEAMDLKMLGWTVPKECPIQNYTDSDGVFHQKVGRVDLGSLDWSYVTNPNRFNADFNSVKFASTSTPIVAYSTKYDIYSFNTAINKDKAISVWGSNDIASFLVVIDSSYTDADTFKNAMKGVYFYYELATHITKTIDGNEAVEELSSNLSQLEFGAVAGGKNLFNGNFIEKVLDTGINYTDIDLSKEQNSIKDIKGIMFAVFGAYLKKGTYTFSYTNDAYFSLNRVAIAGTDCILAIESIRKSYTWTQNTDGWTYFGIEGDDSETGVTDTPFSITPNIQIEKGTQATEYEPYIPSIKMLEDEVSEQNESLSVIGKCKNLLNPVFVSGWGCNCVIGDDGKITLTSTNTEDYQVVIGYIHKCSLKANKTYYFRAFDIINIDHIGIGKIGSDDLLKSFYNQLIYTPTEDMDIQLLIYFSDKTVGTISSCYISVSEVYTDEYVPYTGDGDTLTHDVAELKNDLAVKKFELVAGALWLCVSGKHCVLTLNGYNLTESTHFDKLEEYQPYLVARNVVSKGDSVCIAAVEPNGNINASDLVVGAQLTGQLFGEISWIANI